MLSVFLASRSDTHVCRIQQPILLKEALTFQLFVRGSDRAGSPCSSGWLGPSDFLLVASLLLDGGGMQPQCGRGASGLSLVWWL